MIDRRIKLNPTQVEMCEWALDPMTYFLTEEVEPEERLLVSDLPTVEDGHLVLRHQDATDDLLYRLEEQFEDMAKDEPWDRPGTKTFNEVVQTRRLTKKIRETMGGVQ